MMATAVLGISIFSEMIPLLPCQTELQIDSPKLSVVKGNIHVGDIIEVYSMDENKALLY